MVCGQQLIFLTQQVAVAELIWEENKSLVEEAAEKRIEYEAVQATENVGVRALALTIGATKAARNALDDAMAASEATRRKAAR